MSSSSVGQTGVLMDGNVQLATIMVIAEFRHHYRVRVTNLWAAGAEQGYRFGQFLVVLKSNVALDGPTDV